MNANLRKEECNVQQIMRRVDDKDSFDDMVNMECLNEPEILNNLRNRYYESKIYTYVGPTLISINPYRFIQQLFSADLMKKYISQLTYKEMPPHTFGITAQAYYDMLTNVRNQAIIISGESGAGKTENAKFCMQLLTSISLSDES